MRPTVSLREVWRLGARQLLALATFACLGACSGFRHGASDADPNVITRAEIERTQLASAYDVVTHLRPNFLRDRGRTSILLKDQHVPELFIDGLPAGDLDRLRDLTPDQIAQI